MLCLHVFVHTVQDFYHKLHFTHTQPEMLNKQESLKVDEPNHRRDFQIADLGKPCLIEVNQGIVYNCYTLG